MTLELEWNTETTGWKSNVTAVMQLRHKKTHTNTHGSTIEKIQELDGWCVVV